MIVKISEEDKQLYAQTYSRVVSELQIANLQFEELRCKIYALNQAEKGLSILLGKYDIEYLAGKKQFSWTKA